MSKKKHIPAPVPPANRPGMGPPPDSVEPTIPVVETLGFPEQDPKRRLGDFVGTGEHARQGPQIDGKTQKKGRGKAR